MHKQDAGDTHWSTPPTVSGGAPPARPPASANTYTQPNWLYVGLLAGALLGGVLWKRIVHTIPAGYHGVIFHRISGGTLTERAWDEGLHLIAPWDTLTMYETRLQTRTLLLKVPSEEGMELSVSVALRYRPSIESLGYLHKDIGPDYFNRLVLPEVQGHLRKILGKRPAHVIYTGSSGILEEVARVPMIRRLYRDTSQKDGPGELPASAPYVLLEELRVLDIERPALVAEAVNEKQRQEQLSLEYKHRLQREEQESARKRVEAAGIHDYNQAVGKLHPEVLQWRNMETTLELARSNNAKVVVLGNGQSALPLTLNLGDSSPPGERTVDKLTPPAANKTQPAQVSTERSLPLLRGISPAVKKP